MDHLQIGLHSTRRLTSGLGRFDAWDGTGSRMLRVGLDDLVGGHRAVDIVSDSSDDLLATYERLKAKGAIDLGSAPRTWLVGHGRPWTE